MDRGSGVHGQLVGEMIRAAVAETDPPIRWSIAINERGVVRLELLFDLHDRRFGGAIEEKVDAMIRANVTGTVDDYRERLAHGVRTCCRSIRRAADAYLAKL